MCGIAGFTHRDYIPDPARIAAAAVCIDHRGPDQSGTYESAIVSLGAVRLKIIDLEGGEQPMRSLDGDTILIFNGEVYNHVELRKELEGLGVRFRSRSDTEVVLHSFLRWDVAAFRRLRGMFAFAIWQESRRRLILVRDRLGIKPLYYRLDGGDIHFGSELKTLFGDPGFERRLDPDGLNYFLSLNYIPSPFTAVQGIRKLRPGQWLEWQDGRIRTDHYWQLRFQPHATSLPAAKEELDALLRASVREHLIADVPLGVWSSGGLDSSTVVHYAAAEASRQLKTFSVSFRGRSFDESRWFREIAAQYGTEHHEFDLAPGPHVEDTIRAMAVHSDEPSADAGAVPVWYLSQMSRRHVTVALSGEGADELFGGYNTYLADRYAERLRRAPAFANRVALKLAHALPVSDEKIGFDYKLTRLLEGAMLPANEAHFYWNGTFSAEARKQLLQPHFFRPITLPGGDPLYVDQLNYLPDDILYKTDRMSMAHSLEVRPPFLDHRIVEFAARLPADFKVRGTTLKFVLRELMRDKLPQSVLVRKKEGFDIPTHDWLRTLLKPLVLDTLNRDTVTATGAFEWPVVQSVLLAHLNRRRNYGYHIWGLLTLFLWIKQWKIGATG